MGRAHRIAVGTACALLLVGAAALPLHAGAPGEGVSQEGGAPAGYPLGAARVEPRPPGTPARVEPRPPGICPAGVLTPGQEPQAEPAIPRARPAVEGNRAPYDLVFSSDGSRAYV